MSTKSANLTTAERTLKNAEYEALKNASIAILQALPQEKQDVIAEFTIAIKALQLPNATFYDEATFYHVMDACKQAYYNKVKPANPSPVAQLAPVVSKAKLTVQPTPTGNIVTVADETPAVAVSKPTKRKAEKATSDNDVLNAIMQQLAAISADNARIKAEFNIKDDATVLQDTEAL